MARLFDHSDFSDLDPSAVSVILPARECAATVGPIVASLAGFGQVAVVDASSRDGTARIAAAAGAEVFDESELLSEFGPVRGKGDAMWRALSIVRHEIVVYVDADTTQFERYFATGLAGPLVAHDHIHFGLLACRRDDLADQGDGIRRRLVHLPVAGDQFLAGAHGNVG